MAHRSFLSIGAACVLSVGFAQKSPSPSPKDEVFPLRTVSHNAFQPGEKLTYVLHYGWLNAGEATLELKQGEREIEGRKVLHAVGKGQSTGAFKAFFNVDDRYETWFDQQGVFPWVFTRRVNEGGYSFSQDYLYLQHRRKVTTQENKTYDVPASAQDMLSAFYFARTMDYSNATPGQEYTIPCFMDNEEWNLRMRYVGKETIKLRNGKFRCLKFQPVVQQGRIFKANDDLNVWITDDANHIPVLAEAKVLVGSIKMELSSFEGLANPVAKL
ncbi:MAG: DUF3108 domain-containing protein [Flavobacteriales bacterium]